MVTESEGWLKQEVSTKMKGGSIFEVLDLSMDLDNT